MLAIRRRSNSSTIVAKGNVEQLVDMVDVEEGLADKVDGSLVKYGDEDELLLVEWNVAVHQEPMDL